jgi:MoaA/NifB/PqqE/SkfB family radical SAM enzyme
MILPTEYGPFVRELLSRAATRRQPANAHFELTSRCNLSCSMCYIRLGVNDSAPKKELPASAWLSLAREAVENGMVFLLLTGGEIFLRPDFFQIYEPLTRMGLILTLFTNGTLITPEIAKRLAHLPPSRMEITLYGATEETYDAVTGIPGSYTRCCNGIELLLENRIPLGLKTTLTRQSVGELQAMRRMAHSWGVPLSAGWLLSKRRDGYPSNVENCRLSAQDCVTLESTDQVSVKEWTEVALRGPSTPKERGFYCQAGRASFLIDAFGEMNVCLDLPFPKSLPLKIGFHAAWKEVQRYVDSAPPVASVCFYCDARAYCPCCPAWSLMETGKLTEPVPYLCEIAQARKQLYDRHA